VLLVLFTLPSVASRTPVILVLGDSLSAAYGIALNQGWVSLLQSRLQQQGYPHRVVNASISGDTSAGGLTRLPAALESHQPSILILELGANDGLRAQPVSRLRENLDAMISLGEDAGAQTLLIGVLIPPNYGLVYTNRFREVYPQLATKHGINLVPFLLEGVATDPGLMQADGLHPTAAAQPGLLDNVWPKLEPLLDR
jgi:acyl-CoA thioesterase-1